MFVTRSSNKASIIQKISINSSQKLDMLFIGPGLELDYFKLLDESNVVKYWGSEEVTVPYYFNGKLHTYYIDLFVEMANGQKMFIELKPYRQTQQPKWTNRRKKESYLAECVEFERNKAKWQSAVVWASQVGAQFKILTEKNLQDLGK